MRWFILFLLGATTPPLVADDWRLAGTVLHGEGAALIEVQGRQVLVRLGEAISDHASDPCRLAEVTGKAARLNCPDGARLLIMGGLLPNERFRDTHQFGQFRDTHESRLAGSLDRQHVGEIFEERQRLVSEIPLEPVVGESGIAGYRLTEARPGSLALRAGFSLGDIVRSVNGVETADSGAFMQVLNNLSDARQVHIGFERDGRTLEALILLD